MARQEHVKRFAAAQAVQMVNFVQSLLYGAGVEPITKDGKAGLVVAYDVHYTN